MHLDDMILVSVDDHIIEPPTVFENHIPKSGPNARRASPTIRSAAGRRGPGGRLGVHPVHLCGVTLPNEEWGHDPRRSPRCARLLRQRRAGPRHGRQRDPGVDVFPSFAGMDGIFFAKCQDRELGFACLQAYNDWHIDEWAGSHPGRFIRCRSARSVARAVGTEVRRVARKGATAISFSEAPDSYGYPSIHSRLDPFFAACQEEDVAIAIHIASSNMTPPGQATIPMEVASTLPCWNALPARRTSLVQVAREIPNLKIALSEGGTSWIPGFLDRMERQFHHQKWVRSDWAGSRRPRCFGAISSPASSATRLGCSCATASGSTTSPTRSTTRIRTAAFRGLRRNSSSTTRSRSAATSRSRRLDTRTHCAGCASIRSDTFRARWHRGRAAARAADVDVHTRSKADYRREYEAAHGPIA